MRRRELQTIQLKLSELKEYEQAKLERAKARQQQLTPRTPTPTSTSDRDSDSSRLIDSAGILKSTGGGSGPEAVVEEDPAIKPSSSTSS